MKPTIAHDIDLEAHTAEIVDGAVDDLGARAGLWGVNSEPGLQLFLLGHLKAELDARVLDTIWDCRAHDHTWNDVGELLGITAELAKTLYDHGDPAERELPQHITNRVERALRGPLDHRHIPTTA